MWCGVGVGPQGVVASGLVEGAEGEDGVEAGDGPVHAGAFGSLFDDGVAGGFDVAGADVVAVGFEVGVLHAVVVVGEVAGFAGGVGDQAGCVGWQVEGVAAADLERAEQSADGLRPLSDQPHLVSITVGTLCLAGGVLAGPVDHPGHRGQPDPGRGALRRPLDRLQHPCLPLAGQPRGGVDQGTSLSRGDLGDPVGQRSQGVVVGLAVEPPFSPRVVAGRLRMPATGPTRARHNASLIST